MCGCLDLGLHKKIKYTGSTLYYIQKKRKHTIYVGTSRNSASTSRNIKHAPNFSTYIHCMRFAYVGVMPGSHRAAVGILEIAERRDEHNSIEATPWHRSVIAARSHRTQRGGV